eukprot:2699305-Alexandrium_andersonii.AAC.1
MTSVAPHGHTHARTHACAARPPPKLGPKPATHCVSLLRGQAIVRGRVVAGRAKGASRCSQALFVCYVCQHARCEVPPSPSVKFAIFEWCCCCC